MKFLPITLYLLCSHPVTFPTRSSRVFPCEAQHPITPPHYQWIEIASFSSWKFYRKVVNTQLQSMKITFPCDSQRRHEWVLSFNYILLFSLAFSVVTATCKWEVTWDGVIIAKKETLLTSLNNETIMKLNLRKVLCENGKSAFRENKTSSLSISRHACWLGTGSGSEN